MTREKLRQYESLIDELREERDRLAREECSAARMEAAFGVGYLFGREELERRRQRFAELRARREDEAEEIRLWIEQVSDSMTRRALKLRYIDGLKWDAIARRMGYADESGPRKLVEKLMEK